MKQDTLNRLNAVVAEFDKVATIIAIETRELQSEGNVLDIIWHYSHIRNAMDDVKKGKEVLEELKKVLSEEIVPDAMAANKLKSPTIEGIGRVTVSGRFSASIIDREELEHPKKAGHDWLAANNAGSLVKPTVNAQTLSAFAKDLTENQGKELPDDIFKVGVTRTTSITKAK